MLEQLRKLNEAPYTLLKVLNINDNLSIIAPYLTPLIFEKVAYYFIIQDLCNNNTLNGNKNLKRKFLFYLFLSGISYLNQQKLELKKYALYCYNNLNVYFKYNISSDITFLKLKDQILQNMGDITLKYEMYNYSSKLYINSILLSLNNINNNYKILKSNNPEQQAFLIKNLIYSISKSKNFLISNNENNITKDNTDITEGNELDLKDRSSSNKVSSEFNLRDIKVPEIVNSSVTTYEEQDVVNIKYKGWKYFTKYNNVHPSYINLSDSDCIILKSLDYLATNKATNLSYKYNNKVKLNSTMTYTSNITNRKTLISYTNKKILTKLLIKNSFSLGLLVTNLKLLTRYSDKDTDDTKCEYIYNKMNLDIEVDEISEAYLEPKSEISFVLSIVPLKPGNLEILGVEICLFKSVSFYHFFDEIDNRIELGLYSAKIPHILNPKIIKYTIYNSDNEIIVSYLNSNNNKNLLESNINNNVDVINDRMHISKESNHYGSVNSNNSLSNNIIYYKLFQYQIKNINIEIHNKSDSAIKKFCVFTDNTDIFLFNYVVFDINIPKNSKISIGLPVCPQIKGSYFVKLLIKFEDSNRLKDIEIKRHTIYFDIIHLINYEIKENLIREQTFKTNSIKYKTLDEGLNISTDTDLNLIFNYKEIEFNTKIFYDICNINNDKVLYNNYEKNIDNSNDICSSNNSSVISNININKTESLINNSDSNNFSIIGIDNVNYYYRTDINYININKNEENEIGKESCNNNNEKITDTLVNSNEINKIIYKERRMCYYYLNIKSKILLSRQDFNSSYKSSRNNNSSEKNDLTCVYLNGNIKSIVENLNYIEKDAIYLNNNKNIISYILHNKLKDNALMINCILNIKDNTLSCSEDSNLNSNATNYLTNNDSTNSIYSCIFYNPKNIIKQLDKSYINNCLKNCIRVNPKFVKNINNKYNSYSDLYENSNSSNSSSSNNSKCLINITFIIKPLYDLLDLNSLEIIAKNDYGYEFIGIKSRILYKDNYLNSLKAKNLDNLKHEISSILDEEEKEKIEFNLITTLKGLVDLNKFEIILTPDSSNSNINNDMYTNNNKSLNNETINFKQLPFPVFLEVDS